jgi:DNA repair protein RadD
MFSSGPMTDDAPPPDLRKYQQKAILELRARIRAGKRRVLLVSPCASGKMFLVAAIIRTSTVPCLFVAHLQELLDQCVNELARQRVRHVGVIRADDDRTDPSAPVQVASIATLAARDLTVFPSAAQILIFLDEAHRMTDTVERLIFERYPNAIIIGLTASPVRLDSKPLGKRYEDLLDVTTYGDLFRQKHLYPPDIFSAPLKPDLSRLTMGGVDFDEAELGEALSKRELTGQLVEHYLRLAHIHYRYDEDGKLIHGSGMPGERRRGILFASSVAHSKAVCERFAAAGVRIAHLDGTSTDRKEVLARLKSGDLELVTNVNILLEGLDIPEIKLVIHARPTLSLVLWMQSCNRALRRFPLTGDPIRPLILDHAGNYDRHYSPCDDREWSLTSGSGRGKSRQSLKVCGGCFAYVETAKILCPYCGWEFPAHTTEREPPKETKEELALRDEAKKDPEAVKRAYFDGRVVMARAKGFRPGWASFQFKKKYDAWPPWAWSEELKASYASDPDWQAAVEKRKREAEYWNEKRAAEAKTKEEEKPAEEETVVEDEDSFAAWVEGQGIKGPSS